MQLNIRDELKEYLNITDKEFQEGLDKTRVHELWNKKPRITEEEVADFYRETDFYLYDLTAWPGGDPERFRWTDEIDNFCREHKLHRILDYGCGIGLDAVPLLEKGYAIIGAEVPSRHFEFFKWRVKKRGLRVDCIDLPTKDELPQVDMIVCIATLEHLVNPLEVVEKWRRCSRYVALNFDMNYDPVPHPMHIRERKEDLKLIGREPEKVGLKRVNTAWIPIYEVLK